MPKFLPFNMFQVALAQCGSLDWLQLRFGSVLAWMTWMWRAIGVALLGEGADRGLSGVPVSGNFQSRRQAVAD